MTTSPSSLYGTIALATAIVGLWRWHRRVKDLPPGPMKLPFIGNLFNMPRDLDAEVLAKMGKEHGSDIIHLEAFSASFIILNSREDAEELLDKRSGIYSSRPEFTMFSLCGWGFQWIFWPYGEAWRNARKIFTQGFTSPDIHRPKEAAYVNIFLKKLLDDPENFFSHIRRLPGAITLDMTYGVKLDSSNEHFIGTAEAAARDCVDIMSATWMVNIIPALKYIPQWFPGAGFQRKAAWSRALASKLIEGPFRASEELLRSGTSGPSFVTNWIEEINRDGGDKELLKRVAATVYLAGSDTSTAVLGAFFLLMVLHEDVQRKIQLELDAVLQGALPRHEDLESLPYLEAVILEILRWRPTVPLAVFHTVESGDIYKGYQIPAGTMIVPNSWAMLQDERDYPQPEQFKPERFIKDGRLDESITSPLDIAFGFGRRICPGRHIALSIIKLTAASVLSTFNIGMAKDKGGNPIRPGAEFQGIAVSQPVPFPCSITPRSDRAAELVRSLSDI